ncbi:transposable element Tcb2 transposase [Trichonephila clavipes]|nr:transposable element Tcb2 transposase [Trichonephila clavipes]
MPLRHFRRQYEPLSQFERRRIIGIMEVWWSARRVARQLGRSDCVWCRAREKWTTAEWNQVIFGDESRFNLSNDDNRVRVWRSRGKLLNPAFALQQHTATTAGVIVWDAIAYNTRSSLVLIRGTMTAQRYVHDILQPHVLPLMQRLPGAIFPQNNDRPRTARVSQHCLHTVTTLPWPDRFQDLSPIEHIWDHLEQRVVHPTTLNALEARLQQIWNEISQDIIQNFYASVPVRISSCIRTREGSTGYQGRCDESMLADYYCWIAIRGTRASTYKNNSKGNVHGK